MAVRRGYAGPIMIDDKVVIQGRARISGDVLIEHHVEITDDAVIEAFDGDSIHLRGEKWLMARVESPARLCWARYRGKLCRKGSHRHNGH